MLSILSLILAYEVETGLGYITRAVFDV